MQELNCNQVVALLTFFAEKKLNPKLMQSIEYHLNICPSCREKYINLRKMLDNYRELKNKIIQDCETEEVSYKEKQYKIFKENLSAYIDNELEDSENFRIRKIAIANADARQDLENILSFRELLKESFQKTKNNLKTDFSGYTINQLYNNGSDNNSVVIKFLPIIVCGIAVVLALILIAVIVYF